MWVLLLPNKNVSLYAISREHFHHAVGTIFFRDILSGLAAGHSKELFSAQKSLARVLKYCLLSLPMGESQICSVAEPWEAAFLLVNADIFTVNNTIQRMIFVAEK